MKVFFVPRMKSRCIDGNPYVCKILFMTSSDMAYSLESCLDGSSKMVLSIGGEAEDGVTIGEADDTVVYSTLYDIFSNIASLPDSEKLQDFIIEVFVKPFLSSKFRKIVSPSEREELEKFITSVGDTMMEVYSGICSTNRQDIDDVTLYKAIATRYSKPQGIVLAKMKSDYLTFKKNYYYIVVGNTEDHLMLNDENGSATGVPCEFVEF